MKKQTEKVETEGYDIPGFGRCYRPWYTYQGESRQVRKWSIEYRINGKSHVEPVGTANLDDAKALLQRRAASSGFGARGILALSRVTLADLKKLIRGDYSDEGRTSASSLEYELRRIDTFFCPVRRDEHGRETYDDTAVTIQSIVDRRGEWLEWLRTARNGKPYSNASKNRAQAILRRMFQLAAEATPPLCNEVPVFKTFSTKNTARRGFFEREQLDALLVHLPHSLHDVFNFAYITGWRVLSMILPLTWDCVDFKRRVVRIQTVDSEHLHVKNADIIEFPFTPELEALLKRRRDVTDRLQSSERTIIPWVFHRVARHQNREVAGQRIDRKWYYAEWKRACKASGIKRIPHDFRRTAARNLIDAGVDPQVACQLVGWRTTQMLEHYRITTPNNLRNAAAKLAEWQAAQAPSKVVSFSQTA